MKPFIIIATLILFIGCSWPKVKIAGDEYLISLLPRESTVTLPNSTKGSGSGNSSVDSSKANQQKQP